MESEKSLILVTEDDYDNQRFLSVFLGKKYEIVICPTDTSLFDKLKTLRPNLIIMDISLRNSKNGLQITQELKTNSEYRSIPIICLTAHAFPQDKDNAYKAGVDLFLAKPIDNNTLLTAIESLINKVSVTK